MSDNDAEYEKHDKIITQAIIALESLEDQVSMLRVDLENAEYNFGCAPLKTELTKEQRYQSVRMFADRIIKAKLEPKFE